MTDAARQERAQYVLTREALPPSPVPCTSVEAVAGGYLQGDITREVVGEDITVSVNIIRSYKYIKLYTIKGEKFGQLTTPDRV
jgi:hypothetical protein